MAASVHASSVVHFIIWIGVSDTGIVAAIATASPGSCCVHRIRVAVASVTKADAAAK
jgi:hypothetical protein